MTDNNTDFTLVFTDFYTICRMFMKFDKDKRTPKNVKRATKYIKTYYLLCW